MAFATSVADQPLISSGCFTGERFQAVGCQAQAIACHGSVPMCVDHPHGLAHWARHTTQTLAAGTR